MQNYPQELIDIFVIADNCTDDTASVARSAGATRSSSSDSTKTISAKGTRSTSDTSASSERYARSRLRGLLRIRRGQRTRRELLPRNEQGLRRRRRRSDQLPQFQKLRKQLDFRRICRLVPARGEIPQPGAPDPQHKLRYLRNRLFHQPPKSSTKHGGWKWHLLTEDIEFSAQTIIDGKRIATVPLPCSTTNSPSPSKTPGTSASAGRRASTRCSPITAGSFLKASSPIRRARASHATTCS